MTDATEATQELIGIIPDFFLFDERGKLELNDNMYIKFLENNGYRTVRKDNAIVLVRIQGNIISKIIPVDIKRFVIEYVESFENEMVLNYVLKSQKMYSLEYLNALKEENPRIVRDTANTAYFFYKKNIIPVTKEGIMNPISYEDFDQLIWSHHILDREFSHNSGKHKESVFYDFLKKITRNDEKRTLQLLSIIGYALHNHRTTANTRAVIFNDELVSDQPEGGSGKSLLVKALGHLRTLKVLDGKAFNPLKPFAWSEVDESVRIILLDDVPNNFQFQDLFSVISTGMTIEKKYADSYHLPAEKSPLLMITSNSLIPGGSGSYRRRQYNIDIHQYFNHQRTPEDEYGHLFFEDWDEEEWSRFDNLMLICVKKYLQGGVKQIKEIDSKKKDAIRATDETFYEWMDEAKVDFQKFTSTKSAKEKYLEETGQKGIRLSDKKFIRYMRSYCEILGHSFNEDRNSEKRGFSIHLNSGEL